MSGSKAPNPVPSDVVKPPPPPPPPPRMPNVPLMPCAKTADCSRSAPPRKLRTVPHDPTPDRRCDVSERRYGQWAGKPNGTAEDPALCVASVTPNNRSPVTAQCSRKRGKGEHGDLCGIHARIERERGRNALWIPQATGRRDG